MKRILIAAMILATMSLTAQNRVGLSLGYSVASTNANTSYQDLSRSTLSDRIMHNGETRGLSYGLTVQRDFGKLFLRSDLVVSKETQAYTVASVSRGESGRMESFNSFEDSRHYISIPLTAGMIFNKIEVGLGPVLNFNIEQSTTGDQPVSISRHDRSIETGANIYVGYRITERFTVSARYIKSLQTLGNRYRHNQQPMNFDQRLSRVDVGLAFYL